MNSLPLIIALLLAGESNAQVTSVTATAPITSSGGTTPDIGFGNGSLVVKSTTSTGSNPVLLLENDGGSALVRVRQDGKVSIGTTTPTNQLSVNGIIDVSSVVYATKIQARELAGSIEIISNEGNPGDVPRENWAISNSGSRVLT